MSYPGNPNMPKIEDVDAVAAEYIRAIDAGATIVHHHGIHYLEMELQADGRTLSNHVVARKFGLTFAHVDGTIRKLD